MMPAQPVDATPSNALIRQCFPGRSDLFGCPRSKPSQGSVPADLTLASDLAFVFNASRVRLECCVDPLRPPVLPVKLVLALDPAQRICPGLQIWSQTTGSMPSRSFTACRSLCLQPRYFSVVCTDT